MGLSSVCSKFPLSCKQVTILFLLHWVISFFYLTIPASDREQSLDIVLREWKFWSYGMFLGWKSLIATSWDTEVSYYSDLHNITGRDFSKWPKNDGWPHWLIYTKENFTSIGQIAEETGMEVPFVIRGLAPQLTKYDYDYVYKNFKTEPKYYFEKGTINVTNARKSNKVFRHGDPVHMPLQTAMERMKGGEPLYLRFSQLLATDNPELDENLKQTLKNFGGDDLYKVAGDAANSRRLCFMGYGEQSKTLMHLALSNNWFWQLTGAKRWRLLSPQYTPYLRPHFARSGALTSGWGLFPEESGLPFLDMDSQAGDLLYFPSLWWHEVYNIGEDQLQFGCGLRPLTIIPQNVKNMLFPLTIFPKIGYGTFSLAFPRFLFAIKEALTKGEKSRDLFTFKKVDKTKDQYNEVQDDEKVEI